MSDQEQKSGGLTPEERANLVSLLRYAAAIFAAVSITLVLVAFAASLLGISP